MSDEKPYIMKINYKRTYCPVCQTQGEFHKVEENLECKVCGCLLETPNHYTAGERHTYGFKFALTKIYIKNGNDKK